MNVLFHVYKLLLVFLSLKLYMYCFLSSKKKNLYIGVFLEYVAKARGSWFLKKGAHPGPASTTRINRPL